MFTDATDPYLIEYCDDAEIELDDEMESIQIGDVEMVILAMTYHSVLRFCDHNSGGVLFACSAWT
jgi:hypothetical protein